MTVGRNGQSATLLLDGRVLITGGLGPEKGVAGQLATAELYDPKTGTFSLTGSMKAHDSIGFTTTLLLDGRVLVVGGSTLESANAELYDPKTGTFSLTGSTILANMFADRFDATATTLNDGRVLVAGGMEMGNSLTSAELFDPKTGTFSLTGSLTVERAGHTATLLPDGRVLVVGGDTVGTADIYEPKTGTVTATGPLGVPRTGHTAT
jgi:hypothetical protein